MSDQVPEIGGRYVHYKGAHYTVLHIAQVEGSRERVVVYQGEDGHIWTRPLCQWFQPVQRNAGDRSTVTRFAYDPKTAETSGRT